MQTEKRNRIPYDASANQSARPPHSVAFTFDQWLMVLLAVGWHVTDADVVARRDLRGTRDFSVEPPLTSIQFIDILLLCFTGASDVGLTGDQR